MSRKIPDPHDPDVVRPKSEDDPGTAKANPVGAAVGAMAGAAAGAAVGILGGPVGLAAGAIAGAIAGGKLGAEEMRAATEEEEYWRERHRGQPYVREGASYADYGPAYRYGALAHGRSEGRAWDETRTELEAGWPSVRGESTLEWTDAEPAVRDAWDRRAQRPR